MVRALSGNTSGWTLTEYLLADIFQGLTGQVHPNRPKGNKNAKSDVKERTKRLQEQQARIASRRKAASE